MTAASAPDLFDDIARWQADAAEALGLQGIELVAALSPGPGFPGMLGALAERIVGHHVDGAGAAAVVDVGAGLGGATAWLAAATGAAVIGVEPEDGSRDAAHRLFGGLDVRSGSAADTGLDAASADVVVAIGVSSLLADLDGLFTEARRLLRPGGFLGIVDMFLADGDVEVDGPNTLRTIATTTQLARAAGFTAELVPSTTTAWARPATPGDADRAHQGDDVELVEVAGGPVVASGDAGPAGEWTTAAARLTAAMVAAHPGSPGIEAWLGDRRKVAAWIESGHVIAGCLALSPAEDAGPRRVADRLLRIYLQDHHATSMAGVRRMRRLADAEADGPDGPALDRIATEIAEDRETQTRVMRALGVQPKRAKDVLAMAAERAGLLKLNGRLVRRSPLTSLDEMEAMTMAVRGKLAGWTSLRATLGASHLGGIDLDELIARSEEHLATLGEMHDRRAPDVLGFEDPPAP